MIGSGDRSGGVQKEITPPRPHVCSCWNAVDLAAEEVLPCVSGQWNHVSRTSDLLTQRGQGRWYHTWHPTPFPFVFPPPPASFPLAFLLTSGNETQPLGPPHHHPQTPRPQEMETLPQAPPLLPTPNLGSLCCFSWLPPPLGGIMQNLWLVEGQDGQEYTGLWTEPKFYRVKLNPP